MSDKRDTRGGAYDPVNRAGKPQPPQVRERETEREAAQPGADVRPEPIPADTGEPLPEGLRRPRRGPLGDD